MSEVEETRTITKLRQNHCDDRVQGLGWGKLWLARVLKQKRGQSEGSKRELRVYPRTISLSSLTCLQVEIAWRGEA